MVGHPQKHCNAVPTLPNLIQRARNAVSQNQSGESIIEILSEIYAIAVDMETKTGKAPS